MPDREPETLTPTESLDEDELRVDPLEAGVEPPERPSAAQRSATTPAEIREGRPHEERLAEEQPDDQPVVESDRPDAVLPADDVPRRHADPDPGEQADQAGGSVADALRTDSE